MPMQKTPALGWPHTEAERYAAEETRKILERGREHGVPPAEPPKRKRGCGCLAGAAAISVGLAILGLALALLIPAVVSTGLSAQDVFSEQNPAWEIESSDEPAGSGGAVRIVAWDYSRDIGRIVMMEPVSYDPGWEERPLLLGTYDDATAERLVDAFAVTFADTDWAYVMEAEPVTSGGNEEVWIVRYRIFDAESQEWSDVSTTGAIRFVDSGAWLVESPPADEDKAVQ